MLFEILEDTGLDMIVQDILKSAYVQERSSIKLNEELREPINIEKGVRQGACSSPILFNLIPNRLARDLEGSDLGVKIDNGGKINCLLYADDIALIAKNR